MGKVAVFLLVATSSLALADTSAPAESSKARVLATLERTACYGTCPVYKLTIYSDGRILWEGADYVKKKGKATAALSAAELSSLRAAFAAVSYFELGDAACYEVTDHPWATTSYDDGSRRKALRHYYGCRSKPEARALGDLEKRIDEIAGTERWIH